MKYRTRRENATPREDQPRSAVAKCAKVLLRKGLLRTALVGCNAVEHYRRMRASRSTSSYRRAIRRPFARGLVACLLIALPTAVAFGSEIRGARVRATAISIAESGGIATALQKLVVTGRAPTHCAPAIVEASVVGNDVDLVLQTHRTDCDATRLSAFSVSMPAALANRAPILGGQIYRVRIYASDAGSRSLIAFNLLDTRAAPLSIKPESGLWWSIDNRDTGSAAAGNGAAIEVQGGTIALSLLGFIDTTGAATWQFGSAPLRGSVATIKMTQPANGDALFAPRGNVTAGAPGARVELEFLSPTRAHAYVVRNEDGRDTDVDELTLSRSRFDTGAIGDTWDGQWVLINDDGAGAPVLIDFSRSSSSDAESFRVVDATHDFVLDCKLDPAAHLPQMCALSVADEVIANFDAVGIDWLQGRSQQTGATAKLVRVPR